MDKPQSFKGRIVTVSEYLELLNEYIKPLDFSIIGEVSSVTDRSGSAVFFTVSDEEEQAVMNCVIWRGIYRGLGFKLEVGMKIKMSGYPNIYKQRGSLSYVVQSIIPTGEGVLLKAFEELKAKLDKEGFFEPKRKRLLPRYITKIGLITAKQSDAIKDFETHLGNFGTIVYVHDVRVEGFSAIENIVGAMKTFNESMLGLEVLVITRGGGSLESLQAFNNEALVREIANFEKPVMCGIGHDKDVPLASLIADLMVSTPTAITVALNKSWDEAISSIRIFEKDIIYKYQEALSNEKRKIEILIEKLKERSEFIFKRFEDAKNQLMNKLTELGFILKETRKNLNKSIEYILTSIKDKIKEAEKYLERAEERLKNANPENQLKLGYSIVSVGKKIVKSIKDVNKNEKINIRVSDGKIRSQVEEIISNK